MINTEQDNYDQLLLTSVTKLFSYISEKTNGLKQNECVNATREEASSDFTFRKVYLTRELNPVKEYDRESAIYDEVADDYSSRLDLDKQEPILYTKQTNLTLNEKLKRTQPIWYLPNVNSDKILKKLRNKNIGVSLN